RAHEQLHRGQRGAAARRPWLAPPPRVLLARGAGPLPHPHRVSHRRRQPRGAGDARRRAALARGRQPLRRLRPVPPSVTTSTTSTTSTNQAGGEGAVVCGIFGAVSLSGAPLRHPGSVGAIAAAPAHRSPTAERL